MIMSVYGPLVLPLLAVPVLRWVGGRLHPAWASWLVTVAALVLATCATLALSLLMFAGLSSLGVFARLGHWSPVVLHQLDAIHPAVDVVASVLLVGLVANLAVAAIRRVRALLAAYRTARCGPDGSELMVYEDDRPLAYALPGRPGRIVVSTSMLSALEPAERRALLAHERAHLANAHHLFVAVVDVLAAVNPLLRPLSGVIRYTTERWADEVAARRVGSRSVVAHAVARAALAGDAKPASIVALGATTGPVPRRVAALLAGPPAGRLRSLSSSLTAWCAVIACCMMFGSVFLSFDAATDLHRVVELAQYVRHQPR
jgi:hypothetical protein